MWAYVDADMCGRLSPEWCLAIAVVKITIAALKDVWQPEANPTISVDEENGELERDGLHVAAYIDIVSWGPPPLGYNSALCQFDAEVKRLQRILARNPYRWRL